MAKSSQVANNKSHLKRPQLGYVPYLGKSEDLSYLSEGDRKIVEGSIPVSDNPQAIGLK